jgi:CRP-like cAMP-binding protein
LLQEGDICKYVSFVEKGMLRTYTIGEKGNEYILSFPMDGWWTADLYSFFTGEPSLYNIEALENCELLLLTKSSWNMLLEKMPALERYFRIIIQNNLIAMQRRLLGSMSETAQEKYTKLVATFPDCIQRVPQHMIASYLGISRETLSRIRRQIAVQK